MFQALFESFFLGFFCFLKLLLKELDAQLGLYEVALDYDSELVKAKTSNKCDAVYTLPDGNVITLSDERFRCPEILFKPNLNGFELDGIDKIIFDSIMKCKNDEHKDLLNNIVLTGGCSMFDGFTERVEKEILKRVPQSTEIKIIAPFDRKFSAWIG